MTNNDNSYWYSQWWPRNDSQHVDTSVYYTTPWQLAGLPLGSGAPHHIRLLVFLIVFRIAEQRPRWTWQFVANARMMQGWCMDNLETIYEELKNSRKHGVHKFGWPRMLNLLTSHTFSILFQRYTIDSMARLFDRCKTRRGDQPQCLRPLKSFWQTWDPTSLRDINESELGWTRNRQRILIKLAFWTI